MLLGHRRLVLNGEGAAAAPEENLGLLRSPELPVFDALARLPEIAPPIRAALVEGPPVTVAKAIPVLLVDGETDAADESQAIRREAPPTYRTARRRVMGLLPSCYYGTQAGVAARLASQRHRTTGSPLTENQPPTL